MNRVIIINLNGNAYQLEESGYDALRTYLDLASRRLEGNPDKEEIIADIEQAIADKFRGILGINKTVVLTGEVEIVITEMGPVEGAGPDGSRDFSSAADSSKGGTAAAGPGGTSGDSSTVRRLYRIYPEGAMVSGVCNGLAAYFNTDVSLFRLLFALVTLFWGVGIVVYIFAVVLIPLAKTTAEKTAAVGGATTAEEFIRRAKEGYYAGMKTFHDKHARREWKRKFKQEARNWQRNFQHEVQRHTHQWRQSHPRNPGWGGGSPFAGPLFGLINATIAIIAILALYSLVTRGVVFGLALPSGIPLWIGIVALIVFWHLVAWPFKAMQWSYHYRQGYAGRCTGPFGSLGDFIAGLAFLALALWVMDRYVPQFHETLKQVPPVLHQALDSAQRWLEKH